MILSKAGKLSLLAALMCLLLMVFAGASYGAIRFDVLPSPTEVINTGRSEVTGSINLQVNGAGLTGTSTGGWSQIGVIYNNGLQIDNTTTTGIKISFSSAFIDTVHLISGQYTIPTVISVQNLSITGRCSGFLTINIPPGLTVSTFDYIRIEGVRGRIDLSDGNVAGTDLYAQLQSINDPSAANFYPETVRVAKSLPGMTVNVVDDNVLLCFPTVGTVTGATPAYFIRITEGFVRAFVSGDSAIQNRTDSGNANLQVQTAPALLGSPTQSTRVRVVLNSIPSSIKQINWPLNSSVYTSSGNSSWLTNISVSDPNISGGIAYAEYEFVTTNQTNFSDINLEWWDIIPVIQIAGPNQTASGIVLGAAALRPFGGTQGACDAPGTTGSGYSTSRPRFATLYQSSNSVTSTDIASTTFDIYATDIRCNCFLLFTYMTKDSFWNTGIVIANTTGDDEVFGATVTSTLGVTTGGAPNQTGSITFYFYDKTLGYVGATTVGGSTPTLYGPGQSFVGLLSQVLPSSVTSFGGYVIAKAQFQFCHGYAFIADSTFANIAQGYLANVIPDPAIKGAGLRRPVAAGDAFNIAAGESINN